MRRVRTSGRMMMSSNRRLQTLDASCYCALLQSISYGMSLGALRYHDELA